MEQMVLAASKQVPPLRSAWPEAPAALASVVDKALAFDKEKRFASALEMKAALEAAQHEIGRARPTSTNVEPETSVPFLLVRK
jgi:hypothetical protein